MSVLGIFCRPDHPEGYGQCGGRHGVYDHSTGTAHGYVTLVVQCEDWIELNAVRDRLQATRVVEIGTQATFGNPPARWDWEHRDDGWYGGRFELVFATASSYGGGYDSNGNRIEPGRFITYGDNRAMAYLTGKEVLRS